MAKEELSKGERRRWWALFCEVMGFELTEMSVPERSVIDGLFDSMFAELDVEDTPHSTLEAWRAFRKE